MYDTEKCYKCNKGITDHEEIWNNGLCDSCKSIRKSRMIVVFLILGIVGISLGFMIGLINFNLGIKKCSNLKSSESSYDFDKTIELDARYNKHCYFINNHPLAFLSYVGGGSLIGLINFILIGWMINLIWRLTRWDLTQF